MGVSFKEKGEGFFYVKDTCYENKYSVPESVRKEKQAQIVYCPFLNSKVTLRDKCFDMTDKALNW